MQTPLFQSSVLCFCIGELLTRNEAGIHGFPHSNMKKSSSKKTSLPATPKRRRAVITAALRKEAVSMLKSGKVASVVAGRLKISIATVYNIKKAAGLVKPRASKAIHKAKKK